MTDDLMGKKPLALALGWSRNKLERRLKEDGAFPVEAIGDQAGGWSFSLEKVLAHLDSGSIAPQRASQGPRARRRTAHHAGEASARQRKLRAQADLAENDLRHRRAELVEVADLRNVVGDILAVFDRQLTLLAAKLVSQCALPPEATPVVEKMIDEIRTELHRGARPLLEGGMPMGRA